MKASDAVAEYLDLKSHNTAIQKQADALIAANKERMAQIELAFSQSLTNMGTNTIGTDEGNVRKAPTLAFKAQDWQSFYEWLVEDIDRVQQYLHKRLSNKELEDFVRENNTVPPGLHAEPLDKIVISKNTAQQKKSNTRRAQIATAPAAAVPTTTAADPGTTFDI